MANDIKQKIVLEGEKEYNRALSEAKRNLKTLRSELKAETAELGSNATAQQKNETRIKSLQKQIKEQEKIVRTYQEALKEVKEKYSDNEDAIAKWEVKLNDARTSLASMKNELDGVSQGFENIQGSADMATVASKSVADAFSKLADVGGAISDSIENAFVGLTSFVKETVSMIWGEITDLAAKSNGLVDLAGYWNTDVLTIQKYKGAVAEASGSLEDLNTIVTKINAQDSKKITELVGVSKENYEDEWEYAMAVMEKLSQLRKGERNEIGFELFGRGATKAFDLLNDWETVLEHLDKYDPTKGGYGLTEGQLSELSDLYDKINGMKESWQSLRDMVMAGLFGNLTLNLVGNAQSILDALLQYMNAGNDAEREAAIKQIEDNILAMFEAAKSAIEKGVELLDSIAEDLKKSDNPTAKALGNILDGIVSALQWLTEDNMKNVVKAFEILAGFWAAGKGLQMFNTIAALASNLKTIALSNALSGAGFAAAGTSAGASWGGAFAKAVLAAAPWLAGLITLLTPAGSATEQLDSLWDKSGNPTQAALDAGITWTQEQDKKMGDDLRKSKEEMDGWLKGIEAGADLLTSVNMTKEQWQAVQDFWDIFRKNPTDFTDEEWNAYEGAFNGNAELFDKIEGLIDYFIQAEHPDDWQSIEDLPSEWWQTQGGNAGNTEGLTSGDARSMTAAVNSMPSAVARSVSGLRVTMDGATVGHIVAPYVSQYIAQGIQ